MASKNSSRTIQQLDNACVHDWYRFVLAYPDHLVADLIERFGITSQHTVLDPFVGTGTTLVECKKHGIPSIGIDANPVTAFASRVKTHWDIDLVALDARASAFLDALENRIGPWNPPPADGSQLALDSLLPPHTPQRPAPAAEVEMLTRLIPKGALSPRPLQKVLAARSILNSMPDDAITDLLRLALAAVAVRDMSNLGFGPEIYVKRKKRSDADLYGAMARKIAAMRRDLVAVRQIAEPGASTVYCADARALNTLPQPPRADFVITSPPYPNEKDYTRITRLELTLLSFIHDRAGLRHVKDHMLRSHSRNIYVNDSDAQFVTDIPQITALAGEIETRRIARGATSGFEKLYHRVVTEYFGGMVRVLAHLETLIPPGGKLAFVVGDQMSYFQVPIRTAELLSLVACTKLTYREIGIEVWRTRAATATRQDIEEHILVLERT